MFWLFWQLVGVVVAIGGGALAAVLLIAPIYLLGWLLVGAIALIDRRRASVARAEAEHEARLRAAAP